MLGIVTGMVAGLGTITPASGYVGPTGALVIGLVAGVVCFFATQTLKRKLQASTTRSTCFRCTASAGSRACC